MPRISTYITDSNINPEDRLLGSDDASGNKPTRQYRIGDLIDFIASGTNTDGLGYRYSQSKDKNTSGYFSTDNTAIRSVTEIYLNNITKEGIDATQLFKVMKDDVTPTYFKIADSKDPSKIAYFNINAIDIQAKNAYVKFSVTLMNTLGYGSFVDEKDYYFVLDVVTQADVPTKTSQLENDGEDGLNPFISFADLYTNNAVINYGYYNIPGTYQYFVWADRYIINGVTYSNYISDTITLDASDPDFDRIDLIVLNSDETISNITGIASSNPVRPEIDESTQVVVTFVIVGQASTSPDDVENTLVYNENAQQVGGEADTTKNSANIDLENTAQAYSGTKSVRFLNSSNGDYANFELEDSFYRNDINFLVFFIKLINTVNHNIQISFVKTGISIGGPQSLTLTNGKYGFERSNVTDWQAIAIPIVDFNLTASSYKNIRIKNQRNGASFYVDNIFLQKTNVIPNPQVIEKTSDIPLNDGEDGTSRYTEEIDFKTVGGVSIIGAGDIPVGGDIYNPYGTIALMLLDQAGQTDQQIIKVTNASGDTNISFAVGETKLHAYYEFNGVATGSIDDYTLISAPYGNHSAGGGGATVPIARTGDTILFDVPAVYNEAAPIDSDIIIDETGQVSGITQIIYHKGLTVPNFTVPAGKVFYFNDYEYINDNISINIIFITTTVEGNYITTVKNYDYTPPTPVYEDELQVLIDSANLAGDLLPSEASLLKMNNFIAGLKNLRDDADTMNTDVLAKMDSVQIYLNSKLEFAKYDFITGTKDAIRISSIAYEETKGWRGASGKALQVKAGNFNSGLTHFTQNDASVVVYQQEVSDGYVYGSLNTGSTKRTQLGYGSGSYFFGLNGGAPAGYAKASTAGLIMQDRINSSEFKVYFNGVLETTITNTSVGVPDQPMYVCARYAGGVSTPTDGVVGLYMCGSSIRDYALSLKTLIDSTLLS